MIRFDEHSLLSTAHAVFKLNPSVRERFAAPAELVGFMRALAEREIGDHAGYVGTFGFYLTTCCDPSGNGWYLASPSERRECTRFYCIATVASSLIVGDMAIYAEAV